ncbi:MAG: hypothetical protein HRT89_02465 [Lentisphaeria bacterium]|nr:hypothetical protein [Lentisphaeria bacterium]NQZ66912.1 hypothetical protein [Lentisphaeria bacterium]
MAKTDSSDKTDLVIDLPTNRKPIRYWILSTAVTTALAIFLIFYFSHPPFLICIILITAAFTSFIMIIYIATMEQSLFERKNTFVYRRKTALWCTDKIFRNITGVTLARPVEGFNYTALSIENVREEYDKFKTHPNVRGIGFNHSGIWQEVPVFLPFEEILVLAEKIRDYSAEHGIQTQAAAYSSPQIDRPAGR